MNKITYLENLYKESVIKLTANENSYKDLLISMSRYYKRSFDNAVLIHEQNPNATQLATFDEWHSEGIDRSINKGARGLAVIDMSNPTASFKYIFDLLDTNGTHESFRKIVSYMWELEEQYKPSLMIKFHDKYGVSTENIESCIYELIYKRVFHTLKDKLENFTITDQSSDLYGMPVEVIRQQFSELIINSTYYMVASRAGISTDILSDRDFENIKKFGNLKLFMELGGAIMSIARPTLREINQEIDHIKIERSKIYEERVISEPNIHRGRGRTDVSEPSDIRERTNRGSGKIREDVERLDARESPTEDNGVSDHRQNKPSDSQSGQRSRGTQGETNTADISERADTRSGGHISESNPHDNDLSKSRRTDYSRGTIPSEVTTKNEKPSVGSDKKLSTDGFFVIPKSKSQQEEIQPIASEIVDAEKEEYKNAPAIDTFLCASDIEEVPEEIQLEIYKYFMDSSKDMDDKAELIRNVYYGIDIKREKDSNLKIKADENGLHFWLSLFTNKFCTYREIAGMIDNLISQQKYPFSEPVVAHKAIQAPKQELSKKDNHPSADDIENIANGQIVVLESAEIQNEFVPTSVLPVGTFFDYLNGIYIYAGMDSEDSDRHILRSLEEKNVVFSFHTEGFLELMLDGKAEIVSDPEISSVFGYNADEEIYIWNTKYKFIDFDCDEVILENVNNSDDTRIENLLDILVYLKHKQNIIADYQETTKITVTEQIVKLNLDEDEESDLIDEFILASYITDNTLDYQSDIHNFFIEHYYEMPMKTQIVRACYGNLNTSYTTEDGEYIQSVKSDHNGITLTRLNQNFYIPYEFMVQRIDHFILLGEYPFSNTADFEIDDYSIPNEIDEMNGVDDFEYEEVSQIEETQEIEG